MVVTVSILAVLIPSVYASGYGTSSISFSQDHVLQNNLTINAGSNEAINYTVNLATGNSWGTTFQLARPAPQGITVVISNPSNYSVPFSGYVTISIAPSLSAGSYQLVFMATGDDPSTSNATLTVNVPQASNNTGTQPSTTIAAAPTTTSYYTDQYKTGNSANTNMLIAFVVIVLILSTYSIMRWKPMSTKMIVIGVALILIGTAVWLYGDYGAGPQYIWPGVIAIILGTAIWVFGDYRGGAFGMPRKK